MCGLSLLTIPLKLLLLYFLLHPVDAVSHGNQTNAQMHPPSSVGSWSPSSGLSCQTLHPKFLPGFTHMAPLPKFLISLPLLIALQEAGCQDNARALQLQLHRQAGVEATQILLGHLRELQKGRSTGRRVSAEAEVSALQLLAQQQVGHERTPRSLPMKECENEEEQRVYKIVQMLPGVATFYNLGTALYYITQNCSDKAKERGQDGAIDLGYDLLMTVTGLSAGPTGLWVGTALKPAVKAGVHKLISSMTGGKEDAPPQEPEGLVGGISDGRDVEGETTRAPLVPEVVTSASYWGWYFFSS
ncbi:apolipoprotein F [Sorex fumeus]|uniref:apolipoprotein F n=1 Tax=Sorex fumeus TaxID=62283 RepID=UPI0024ADC223|nr:apolipoprotein F [Sorex fumeus]XP_055976174.1 apolipoprotein F [Sorex fumeus]XP_055976175.1 apolipoprotein F [Sorex fumeus]XP_055976176.1 apolipoprotein F [Sorex fumeus]